MVRNGFTTFGVLLRESGSVRLTRVMSGGAMLYLPRRAPLIHEGGWDWGLSRAKIKAYAWSVVKVASSRRSEAQMATRACAWPCLATPCQMRYHSAAIGLQRIRLQSIVASLRRKTSIFQIKQNDIDIGAPSLWEFALLCIESRMRFASSCDVCTFESLIEVLPDTRLRVHQAETFQQTKSQELTEDNAHPHRHPLILAPSIPEVPSTSPKCRSPGALVWI